LVPKKTIAMFEEMKELVEPTKNYASLRFYIKTSSPPMIPYLGTDSIKPISYPKLTLLLFSSGIYLSDLTYLDDGLPNEVSISLPSSANMLTIYGIGGWTHQLGEMRANCGCYRRADKIAWHALLIEGTYLSMTKPRERTHLILSPLF